MTDLAAAIARIRFFASTWEDQEAEVDEESRLTVPDLLAVCDAAEKAAGMVEIPRLTVDKLDAERAETEAHPS